MLFLKSEKLNNYSREIDKIDKDFIKNCNFVSYIKKTHGIGKNNKSLLFFLFEYPEHRKIQKISKIRNILIQQRNEDLNFV